MDKEKVLQEFEEFAKAKMGGSATLLNEFGLIDFLSHQLDQLQDEQTKELKEWAKRADDHFAGIVGGMISNIMAMRKQIAPTNDSYLWVPYDEGYNQALQKVIDYLNESEALHNYEWKLTLKQGEDDIKHSSQ